MAMLAGPAIPVEYPVRQVGPKKFEQAYVVEGTLLDDDQERRIGVHAFQDSLSEHHHLLVEGQASDGQPLHLFMRRELLRDEDRSITRIAPGVNTWTGAFATDMRLEDDGRLSIVLDENSPPTPFATTGIHVDRMVLVDASPEKRQPRRNRLVQKLKGTPNLSQKIILS